MQPITRHNDERIDELEAAMVDTNNFVDCPLNHYFTPKMYVREILMAKDTLVTSKIHKTCHPFVVLQGTVSVKIDNDEWQTIQAPYFGITQAGTRRVLFIHDNTVWQTYHALDFITGDENELGFEEKMKIVESIEDLILEPYENKLLGGVITRNQITNKENILI